MLAYHISITGVVQGVGFRPFVYNLAKRLGLYGWVLNHSGGVDIEVEGDETATQAFIAGLRDDAPPLAHIESLDVTPIDLNGFVDFEIRHSQRQAGQYQLISPDVATCADCVRELFDPDDRRYRYPFINCTNCGPRFTIIADIPYDRPNTTMRVFPLCEDCRAEYENPADRRFHAQPNACPVCGPHIWIMENPQKDGEDTRSSAGTPMQQVDIPRTPEDTEAVFARAKALLLAGKILAIKGLGGFHLACDATNAEAVRILRERKRRPHKPFAVMVPTVADVRAHCVLPDAAETLLMSPQCPIVLLERLPNSCIVPEVAPGSHILGMMVPYTPLHHILLRDVGRPLVMTSGNVTEEPIAKDNAETLSRLGSLADAFLLHNRDIYARYDDSVVQILESSEAADEQRRENQRDVESETRQPIPDSQIVRRARGYAPFPIRLPFDVQRIFSAGPLLKNTFCLTRDNYAFLSQHIGDLENLETLEHYEATLTLFQHLFRLEPERVACDMHPDYLSTRFATQFARERGLLEPIRVQHHQAHIASCLADNGWRPEHGPVIGVALDGTGYGSDAAIWGGEWFVGDYHGFQRVAHLDYMPLPGGDTAIRNPWRIAVAYLHTLLEPEDFPAGQFCPSESVMIRQQVERKLNTPLTSSMGRLFDAVSALLGVCHTATYEAQAAIELEQIASAAHWQDAAPYPFDLESSNGLSVVRFSRLFASLLDAMQRDVPVPEISLNFHTTVAEMITQVCDHIRSETGIRTVALSGGVFQNRLLLQLVLPQLAARDFDLLVHRQVPCNDGGVALGQAMLANFSLDNHAI